MEIKSIKEIKQIGIFTDFEASSKRFERITILYGYNKHGKSTLSDILRSLANNDIQIIKSRRTIPMTRLAQKVEISYKNGDKEESALYRNDIWEPNNLGENILVFGEDFIHRNVFTGLTIERKNKENFTDFIIGEEGVLFSEELENLNHEIRVRNTRLKSCIPTCVSKDTEEAIKSFIAWQIHETEDEIEKELQNKIADFVEEKKKLSDFEKILQIREAKSIEKKDLRTILILLRYTNCCLKLSYKDISEKALEKIKEHISRNFVKTDFAESWIEEGLDIRNAKEDSNCPFCGQPLRNVLELLEIYSDYFSEKYIEFSNRIKKALDRVLDLLDITLKNAVEITDNLLVFKGFLPLIKSDEFQKDVTSLENLKDVLEERENNILNNWKNIKIEIKEKIKSKKERSYQRIDEIEYSELKNLLYDYIENFKKAEILNADLIKQVKTFKQEFTREKVIQGIHVIDEEIKKLQNKKERIKEDENCKEYLKISEEVGGLQTKKDVLSKKLEQSQSEYIDKYFSKINDLFKQLGSDDFNLEKVVDRRGNKEVYSLLVKYKGHKITNDQLPYVFSESDRRALALAIFWTKLDANEDKGKTIVVLDDPIASFDNNRITNTIILIESSVNQLGQVLVLTHYPNFVTRFLEITKDKKIPFKIFHVQRTSDNCEFSEISKDYFLLDNHEKKFLRIYNFINRLDTQDIRNELRPYLENHLKRIYCKQIIEMELDKNSLENLIDDLCENGLITNTQKETLHTFRITLNPDSHIYTSNDTDDVINFASKMLSFLHNLFFR